MEIVTKVKNVLEKKKTKLRKPKSSLIESLQREKKKKKVSMHVKLRRSMIKEKM